MNADFKSGFISVIRGSLVNSQLKVILSRFIVVTHVSLCRDLEDNGVTLHSRSAFSAKKLPEKLLGRLAFISFHTLQSTP